MPETPADLWNLLKYMLSINDGDGVRCCLEQVGGYVGRPQSGSHMFNFGKQFGYCEGQLAALGLILGEQYFLTSSQEWQRGLGLRTRVKEGELTDTDSSWKNYLKREAKRRFPQLVVTGATADALLIAYYCRKKYGIEDV